MPPDRGRASRACEACRKQKTRCYDGKSGSACLRCETLGTQCSLGNGVASHDSHGSVSSNNNSATDARLARLEKAVDRLLDRIGEQPIGRSTSHDARITPPRTSPPPRRSNSNAEALMNDPSAAPVNVIRDLAAEAGVQSPEAVRDIGSGIHSEDVINEGLLAVRDAVYLLSIFQEHYGRWVVFGTLISPENLLATIRKSPLLLCACCLIAVRHTTQDLAARLAPQLFERAKAHLSTALLMSPQPIEFFRASLILCMWSTTVGQTPLSIDSWMLSGFALQHCLSSSLFDPFMVRKSTTNQNKENFNVRCIWNHLCLVHLHYCVGTRRTAMLVRAQIDKCSETLQSDYATQFETRMVAEINLYWVIYEYCCGASVDLPKTQSALHAWKQDWKAVLEQPRAQFLEMGFHFAQLLAYERSLKSKSARVRDSLLSEMVRLSRDIIQLAIDTTDERTRHLSDHIYHMITFAAVTLCRLLHLYEEQLTISHNISDFDNLIITLVSWLHSIGLPSHAAHTLGDTVDAFHKKLRPQARPSPLLLDTSNSWMDDLPNFFPELLDTGVGNSGDWNFLPDWEPIYQGPLT